MLQINKINQFYGESHTLWNVDLHIPMGGCVCLMGRNGVGKTTLLKVIMGLLPTRSGTLTLQGKEISHTTTDYRTKMGIGYVPQGREIFSQLTVEENLKVALNARGDHLKEIPEKIYHLFPVLKEMGHRRGGDLSGGQQQQLAIGRALVTNPQILILDEPTEGIQPNIVQKIGDVITQLNQEENLTILLVEQKLPFARKVGKEFYLMDKGKMMANGNIEELKTDLIHQYLNV